jgi:DNA-binding beta-propeller fold protein YncE
MKFQNKKIFNFQFSIFNLLILALLAGCRKDDPIIPEEEVQLPAQSVTTIQGFYLLNEGNMNMNKASLDYYDYATGAYRRNVYGQANPEATLGLGDVGNDAGIYGSKLYTVINCSNKVEVMDVKTTKRLKVIDIKNCRYLTFANGKAYMSAYDGEVQLGEISPNGFVAEIDTATLTITRTVLVGRQPEGVAVVDGKLYVANSGGYSPPHYERTVSVIDLNTFTKIKDIDVAVNLHRLKADDYGNLWISSRGDNINESSKLLVIDTKTGAVKKTFDIACANFTIVGDTAYIIGSDFNYPTNNSTVSYSMINVKSETLLAGSFLPKAVSDAIKTPYGLAVDPASRYIYITDATDYVSPGKLYCIDNQGNTVFTVTTGDIPAHFAFVYNF